MSPINIAVPESLTNQRAELQATLAGIASEEEKLATQRKDIQVALNTITTGIAILSGQPLPIAKPATAAAVTTRRPMSEDARRRISEGLRRSAQAKAAAKAAQVATPAPQTSASAVADALVVAVPEAPVEVPADAQVAVSALQEPAEAPAEAPVPDNPRERRATRKAAKPSRG